MVEVLAEFEDPRHKGPVGLNDMPKLIMSLQGNRDTVQDTLEDLKRKYKPLKIKEVPRHNKY